MSTELSTSLHKSLGQMRGFKSAAGILANRADPPQPSQLDIDKLAGSYHHPAYGTMVWRVEDDTDKGQSDAKMFVAEHTDTWSKYQVELRHVSWDWWMSLISFANTTALTVVFPADFTIRVDGKVIVLNIELKNDMLSIDEGFIWSAIRILTCHGLRQVSVLRSPKHAVAGWGVDDDQTAKARSSCPGSTQVNPKKTRFS